MANRTTAAAVKEIIEVDDTLLVGTGGDVLDPFIETANALVTEVCKPLGYDDTRLELIERWLSAHFYAIRDPRRASEGAGTVQETFQHQLDLNLSVTTYGQQAMMLDTLGGLHALSAGVVKPTVFWAGTTKD